MTGRIPQATIDDLLTRTNLIDIIQPRVLLTKKGHEYQARCPFHDEKTPSFTVSPTKQFYYCFGCGAHGNAISFLMQFDRMEFIDALSYLATQAGIELTSIATQKPDPQEQHLYKMMAAICCHYQKLLRHTPQAIDYLKLRGITGLAAKRYALGYSPPDWNQLQRHFSTPLLLQAGMIIQKSPEKSYDRFRHRIMFPIRNIKGQVIAFGGRSLDETLPKYLNSPENNLFHKSKELYGLYEARQALPTLARLLIVEGYLDVISLHQQGLTYAVATLGTAVNQQHIQKCLRYTNELVFCFDGDSAGRKAAWKALTVAMPLLRDTIHLRFVFLPDGEDPDSLVQKIGRHGFEGLIEKAESLSQVFFHALDQQFPTHSMDAKAQYAHQAMNHFNTMPKGMFYQLMRQELATHLEIAVDILDTPATNNLMTIKSNPVIKKVNKRRLAKTLNPAQLACCLLLQKPQLLNLSHPIETTALASLTMPGIKLLIELIQYLKEQPQATTGTFLSLTTLTSQQQQQVAILATFKLLIPEEGFEVEFYGAIERLQEQAKKQNIARLIEKAKTTELSDAEKRSLQALLRRS